ncbi:MAG: hypothetical protein Q9192_002474 [Flavoplaca navasiana]
MPLFTPFLLLLTALTLPTSCLLLPPSSLHTAAKSDILCYDPRYATHRPAPHDCLTIVTHLIAPNPGIAKRIRYFSRRPDSTTLPLPYTWRSSRELCAVTIDIPGPEDVVAQATLREVKERAMEVLVRCVYGENHLGGFTQVGRENWMQVRVEALEGDGMREKGVKGWELMGLESV